VTGGLARSPAERPTRDELIAHHRFPLDAFQLEAIDALDAGRSVLVAAPTGSGKTVVAEYGVDLALASGRRAFYTTPIKALSNQKFRDLAERLGADRVGLLTGDNAVNGDAPVVVMTTEVLRNMIYAKSPALRDLAVVVLDEVHFLQDTYRGPVWEEVIIHLDHHVQLVCLSATVSNADEVADWIATVRGPTDVVVETRRPVQLDNLYVVGDATNDRVHVLPVLVNGRPNDDALRLDAEGARRQGGSRRGGRQQRRRLFAPDRVELVDLLDRRRMLPAIVFVFSRNQCDQAAATCLAAGVRLTNGDERDRIRAIVDERLAGLDPADLAVLGYAQFLAQLEAGVAAHHAGMVPPFKEVVESCFADGLVKVVFATETLAVGINMPATTVVIEKLTKFTGDHHALLTPAEYTQLTGRAGRRGLDDLGHAVVLWNPFVTFEQVAALASSRSFHLNSVFRPTYNMAANLVRTYTSERAHQLLNLSFAQYQADRDVVKLEARLERRQRHLDELLELARSPFGDLDDYRRTRLGIGATVPVRRSGFTGEQVDLALVRLRPGDIIYVDKGRYTGRAVVLSTAHRNAGLRVTCLTTRRDRIQLTAPDFAEPPRAIGHIDLPDSAVNTSDFQRITAQRLDKARVDGRDGPREDDRGWDVGDDPPHPVESDPDLDERLRAAAQADRVAREVVDLRKRTQQRTQGVSREFDRVLGVLQQWGYVDGWQLTDAGKVLARTFHESDLLVAEAVRRGLLDGLRPAEMAALASVFVYEHRSPDAPPAPWFPSPDVRTRWQRIERLSEQLGAAEFAAGLVPHRPPEPTFVATAFAWAAGERFADVVAEEELSGGDFVRNVRQLIDLLRQLATVAPERATRATASDAADALFRGVVSASSAIDDDELPDDEDAPQ
jgi:ATP-dependent RNA helicase HelY